MQLETFNGKYKYFSDKPKNMYRVGDWAYFPKCPFLYLQKIRLTNIINLQNCVDDIYSGFNPTCRNEINKAKKNQNVKINYAAEYDYCNNIVQQMFKQKGIDRVTQEKILCLDNDNLLCVLLTWNGVESAEIRKNYSYLNRFCTGKIFCVLEIKVIIFMILVVLDF